MIEKPADNTTAPQSPVISLGSIVFFAVVLAVSLISLAGTHKYFGKIYRGWDAQFYFSLSHSFVFDFDTDITNNLSLTPHPGPFDRNGDGFWEHAPRRGDGSIKSKYPVGLSVLEAIPLLAGHLVRQALELAGISVPGALGYSCIELWSVAVGLIIFFTFALTCLYRILAETFSKSAALVGVVGCWLGTGLFYYSTVFPFMAHAVSFALLALIMRVTQLLSVAGPINRTLVWLGLCFATLLLVRPQQTVLIIFLLPMIICKALQRATVEWVWGALLGSAICLVAAAFQIAMNHWQSGELSLSGYSAGGEGFDWLNPQLWVVLFSKPRGLLFYSPIMVLAAIGYMLYPESVPRYAWPHAWNVVPQVYLVAAWSSPEQGDSFGCRMLSDNAGFVALGLAALYYRTMSRCKRLILACSLTLVGWTTLLMADYIGLIN